MSKNIFFLHGFWGEGLTWGPVVNELEKSINVFTPNLFNKNALDASHVLEEWKLNFSEYVRNNSKPGDKNILVGYSLGGRLGFNYLLEQENNFYAAIIISANIFSMTQEQKRQRTTFDRHWAKSFRENSWEELYNSWNELLVFNGSKTPILKKMNRELLAQSFLNWSPLKTSVDSKNFSKTNCDKVIFMVGEKDIKYVDMYSNFKALLPGELIVVKEAGHRVLLDRPRAVYKAIQNL